MQYGYEAVRSFKLPITVGKRQEHLAQMLIEGTTMGVGELLRAIRDAQNNGICGEALRLANDVLSYEEQVVEEMKGYLR